MAMNRLKAQRQREKQLNNNERDKFQACMKERRHDACGSDM
jgi:hypothetical protein